MHNGLNYKGFVIFDCIVDSERKAFYKVSSDVFFNWLPGSRIEKNQVYALFNLGDKANGKGR